MPPSTIRGAVATTRQTTREGELVKAVSLAEEKIKKHGGWFEKVAPRHIDAAQFVELGIASIRRGSTQLHMALWQHPATFFDALSECARLGLVPGTEQFYFVPFRDGRDKVGGQPNPDKGTYKISPIVGYKGMLDMIYRTGAVTAVHCHVVRSGDKFDWEPGLDLPKHVIPANEHGQRGLGNRKERGHLTGVWAFGAMTAGGHSQPVVMGAEEVLSYRARSAAASRGGGEFWGPEWPQEGKDTHMMWRKGLAVDTPIPTPDGWTTMGLIEPGDTVFDMDGQQVTVLGCSEVKNIGCYRVTFRSGASVICDEEHVWPARIGQAGQATYTITELYQAKQAGKPVRVPVAAPVELPAANLPVDPWLLGFWLGDGNRSAATVTCGQRDEAEIAAAILSAGYRIGTQRADTRSTAVAISIRGLRKQLAELGVLGGKHVPAVYLRGSVEQRIALLRGLMDSDGCADSTRKRVSFGNTDRAMRDAVAELARSLGEQVLTIERDATGYGKTVRFYEASWTPTWLMPFTLARKRAVAKLRITRSYGHQVKSIEPVPSVPTRCIGVNSPTRTYLAGTSMIPTHNTGIRRLYGQVPHSTEYQYEMARALATVQSDPLPGSNPAAIGSADDDDAPDMVNVVRVAPEPDAAGPRDSAEPGR